MKTLIGLAILLFSSAHVAAATVPQPIVPYYEKVTYQGDPIDCVTISRYTTDEGTRRNVARNGKIFALMRVFPDMMQLSCQPASLLRDAPEANFNDQPVMIQIRVLKHINWVRKHIE